MASSTESQQPSHSVPHKTSYAAPRVPFLDTSTPAINEAPIELDSTPVSPVAKQHSWPTHGQSSAAIARDEAAAVNPGQRRGSKVNSDQEIHGRLSGEDGLSQQERQVNIYSIHNYKSWKGLALILNTETSCFAEGEESKSGRGG